MKKKSGYNRPDLIIANNNQKPINNAKKYPRMPRTGYPPISGLLPDVHKKEEAIISEPTTRLKAILLDDFSSS
jgi:hypothetical protein